MCIIYEWRYICQRLGGRHFGIAGVIELGEMFHFISLSYLGKVIHQIFYIYSKRFGNGSVKIGVGSFYPLPPIAT